VLTSNNFAIELTIIPLKKPILDKAITDQKIIKGILKPKSKPKKDNSEEKIIELIFPLSRTSKIKLTRTSNKDLFESKEIIKNLIKKIVIK